VKKLLIAIGVGTGLATLLGGGFIAWALDAYRADPLAQARALNDSRVVISGRDGFIGWTQKKSMLMMRTILRFAGESHQLR